jgi:predicted dehydrogenase
LHRILIIGTGSIGERHLRCFKATGRTEVGMCELNEKLRSDVAARYEVRDVYASLDDALAARKWDAAVIATPANTHIPIAHQLADLGIHLFVEKPLSTTTDGIADLIAKVKDKKLTAGVAYVHRAHPVLAAVREQVHSGRFGNVAEVVAVCGQNFPFFRPAYRNIYYAKRSTGGGGIQDALTHIINACEWVVGPITRLACDAAHQVLEGVDVEDTVHLIARHGPSIMGSYQLNQFQAPNETSVAFHCTRGTVRYLPLETRWQWMTEPASAWHDEPHPKMERDDWFTRQENLYLDALEGKRPVLCTLDEGLQTLKVNLAALRSADEGMTPMNI